MDCIVGQAIESQLSKSAGKVWQSYLHPGLIDSSFKVCAFFGEMVISNGLKTIHGYPGYRLKIRRRISSLNASGSATCQFGLRGDRLGLK